MWHYEEHTEGLFKDYIDTFLKIKQEVSGSAVLYNMYIMSYVYHFSFQASGYPSECTTDEQKAQYIADYAAREGIQLVLKKDGFKEGL